MCSSSRLAPNGSSFGCRYVGGFCLLLVFSRCHRIRLEAFSLDGGISINRAAAADIHAYQGTSEFSASPGWEAWERGLSRVPAPVAGLQVLCQGLGFPGRPTGVIPRLGPVPVCQQAHGLWFAWPQWRGRNEGGAMCPPPPQWYAPESGGLEAQGLLAP